MVDLVPLPDPVLLAKLRLRKYSIRSEGKFMLATLDKAQSNIGNIQCLNLLAVKLMTICVTKMPLLQKACHFTHEGKPDIHIKYESW
jgi:hypothetical protein